MPPQIETNAFADLLAAELTAGWTALARPNQLPPPGDDWFIWLLLSGRGFGKTRTLSEFVIDRVNAGIAKRVALVAATAADARDVVVEGNSGILACSPAWNRPVYEPSKRRLTKTGKQALSADTSVDSSNSYF